MRSMMSYSLTLKNIILMLSLFAVSEGLSMSRSTQRRKPNESSLLLDRRLSIVSLTGLLTIPVVSLLPQSSTAEVTPGTNFFTGKPPKVPGAKKRDPNDTKGTKKDPSFLRSVSNCKVSIPVFYIDQDQEPTLTCISSSYTRVV